MHGNAVTVGWSPAGLFLGTATKKKTKNLNYWTLWTFELVILFFFQYVPLPASFCLFKQFKAFFINLTIIRTFPHLWHWLCFRASPKSRREYWVGTTAVSWLFWTRWGDYHHPPTSLLMQCPVDAQWSPSQCCLELVILLIGLKAVEYFNYF